MNRITDCLFIITARGGSVGLPQKNILPLAGKPLIYYTIDAAKGVTFDNCICVSTDDVKIKNLVENYKLKVPFLRPSELATDHVGSREVLLHAINYYETTLHQKYNRICLLQPTSPLRNSKHIFEAFKLWEEGIDMVVSVKEPKSNPYFNLFEETKNGFLIKSKSGHFKTRQESPKIYEFNGAIYIIKTASIINQPISDFKKIKKYVMDDYSSIDIDTKFDFYFCEYLIKEKL